MKFLPTPASMGGLRRLLSSEYRGAAVRVQADLAAASAPIVGPGASSDADGMSTSREGLSDEDVVVVAEGISMGEKVSLYRGRSW